MIRNNELRKWLITTENQMAAFLSFYEKTGFY